jgi:hypothetical protein
MNDDHDLYKRFFDRYDKEKMSKFLKYHHDNPHVFREFCRLARKWRDSGKTKCSAALIGNVIRWNAGIRTQASDGFKLSNDWLPLYARMLMFKDRAFMDFFDWQEG